MCRLCSCHWAEKAVRPTTGLLVRELDVSTAVPEQARTWSAADRSSVKPPQDGYTLLSHAVLWQTYINADSSWCDQVVVLATLGLSTLLLRCPVCLHGEATAGGLGEGEGLGDGTAGLGLGLGVAGGGGGLGSVLYNSNAQTVSINAIGTQYGRKYEYLLTSHSIPGEHCQAYSHHLIQ